MQTSVVVFPVLVVLVVGGGLLQVGVELEERTKIGARGGVRHWEQGERRCLHMILVSSGVGAGDSTDQR
jgi:hypothetical protein